MVLSTVDEHGQPYASYAPFVRDESGNFYVYVSELSRHTGNLGLGVASILMIEDESATEQIYARKRLGFQCQVNLIDRSEPLHPDILSRFHRRHGEVMKLLSSLEDFRLFQIKPETGTFVKGFGRAYRVNPKLTVAEHIGPESQ